MFPLKVNYQQSEFTSVADPKLGQNTEKAIDNVKEAIQSEYRKAFTVDYEEAIATIPVYIRKYLDRSPFRNDMSMYNKLYISTLLTLINSITLPYKLHSRLNKIKAEKSDRLTAKFSNSYKANDEAVIL